MDLAQGELILEKIPDLETENKIIQFLSQYTKNLTPDKLRLALKKTPVTLIKNIAENEGKIIEKQLIKLGAIATFRLHQDEEETDFIEDESYPPAFLKSSPPLPASDNKKKIVHESTFTFIIQKFAEVNKELWVILSLLAVVLAMNYLISGQRMLLGLYTIPTIISAYTFGRRHATLTAIASVLVVVLFTHFKPEIIFENISTGLSDNQWYDITTWGGILILTGYAMGTLHDRNIKKAQELQNTYQGLHEILRHFTSNDQNHCYRVSKYAAQIASYMHFSHEQIEVIRSAALLHGLAKLEISRDLLYKVANMPDESFNKIITIILTHQEYYDGSAHYVSKGESIPVGGQVLFVADAYDALVNDSPYRKAMSPYEAMEIIANGAGADFDPKVVQAFLEAFERDDLEAADAIE